MSSQPGTLQRQADFPNRLCRRDPPAELPARSRAAVLGLLLAACLLPRVWAAAEQDTICPDAVRYLEIVESLRQGDLSAGFDYLDLNVFPAILLLLQQTGEHWMFACAAWNVLVASLAVLPLWGFMRRLLDDRAAILAGLLYAFHPRLVLHSPLVLRDPTFWFLFLLSLYLIWRAVTELRWWLFLTAGAALFLAIHTRTEGWLLVVPLLIWAGRRFTVVRTLRVRNVGTRSVPDTVPQAIPKGTVPFSSDENRDSPRSSDENRDSPPRMSRRLLAGVAACVAVIPAATLLINVTVLRSQPQWHGASLRNFAYSWQWLQGIGGPDAAVVGRTSSPQPAVGPTSSPPAAGAGWVNHPGKKLNQRLIVRFTKTFTYVYGLVVLAGIWRMRRRPLRTDILPCFLIAGGLMVGVWVRYNVLPIDERYFLTVLLVSFPGLALGVLQVADWIARLAERLRRHKPRAAVALPQLRTAAAAGLLTLIAVAGLIDGVRTGSTMLRAWREQADLGRWILEHCGPRQRVTGNSEEMRLVAYYCQGGVLTFAGRRDGARTLFGRLGAPGVVVFWPESAHGDNWAVCREVVEHDAELGYHRAAPDSLPPSCRQTVVLVRTGAELARRGATEPPR